MGDRIDTKLAAVRLHQLEGFFHVARHEGFTRAAQAMPYPITEPALHQQVRKLERALGVILLERGPGRRMVLTPEGRALLRFVAPYFEQLPGILREIVSGQAGMLALGTEALYVEALCADVLAELQQSFPQAQVRLLELDVPQIVEGLQQARLDLGLVGGVTTVPRGLVFEELGRLGMELLVPAGHPLARRRAPLGPRQFDGIRFVVYEPGSLARAFTEHALARAGVELVTAAEASSAASMRSLVRAGLAPAFVPALVGAKRRPQRRTAPDGIVAFDLTGTLREVVDELPRFGILRRARSEPSGLSAAFCEAAHRSVA